MNFIKKPLFLSLILLPVVFANAQSTTIDLEDGFTATIEEITQEEIQSIPLIDLETPGSDIFIEGEQGIYISDMSTELKEYGVGDTVQGQFTVNNTEEVLISDLYYIVDESERGGPFVIEEKSSKNISFSHIIPFSIDGEYIINITLELGDGTFVNNKELVVNMSQPMDNKYIIIGAIVLVLLLLILILKNKYLALPTILLLLGMGLLLTMGESKVAEAAESAQLTSYGGGFYGTTVSGEIWRTFKRADSATRTKIDDIGSGLRYYPRSGAVKQSVTTRQLPSDQWYYNGDRYLLSDRLSYPIRNDYERQLESTGTHTDGRTTRTYRISSGENSLIWGHSGTFLLTFVEPATSTPTDVCPNISGVQSTVPSGYTRNSSGSCVQNTTTNTTDFCPNIAGNQSSVPYNYSINSSGDCYYNPPADVCPNMAGLQSSVPSGYFLSNGQCLIITDCDDTHTENELVCDNGIEYRWQCTPIDVCPNIAGDQSSLPVNYTINSSGNCYYNPPYTPPADVCPNIAGNQSFVPSFHKKIGNECLPYGQIIVTDINTSGWKQWCYVNLYCASNSPKNPSKGYTVKISSGTKIDMNECKGKAVSAINRGDTCGSPAETNVWYTSNPLPKSYFIH